MRSPVHAATLLSGQTVAEPDDLAWSDALSAGSREFRWQEDAEGHITWACPMASQLCGPGLLDLLGGTVAQLFGEAAHRQILDARRQGLPQLRVSRPERDAPRRSFQLTLAEARDAQGRLLGCRGLARDITDQVLLEERLRRSERRMLELAESASEGIAVVQDWVFVFANQHLLDMVGVQSEDLVGHRFMEFIHPDDHALLRDNHRRRLSGQPLPARYEFRMQASDGSIHWLEMSGSLIEWEGRPATMNYIHDITDRKQLEAEVRQLAFMDTLTGLPNRRLLEDRLGQALSLSRRSGDHGAVLYLDLDHFKPLNDEHGHAAGDALLCSVAQRLRALVRASDSVARLGGDEFVVMLSPLPADGTQAAEQAAAVAEKLRQSLSQPHRLRVELEDLGEREVEHRCTASLGVTVFGPDDEQVATVLQRADRAMYRAKAEGRNRVGPASRH